MMSTLVTSITRAGRAGLAGRRAWGLGVPLLVAGALAAGCGSASSGGPHPGGAASSGEAAHSTATATPIAPVPTVSGGPVAAGGAACAGWPASTASAPLPVSFAAVSVERCVIGTTEVPSKGLWTTATLQRSGGDLSALLSALRSQPATRAPDTVCPALAVLPPQLVLISATGEKLVPRIPVGGCGRQAAQVLTALNALPWQPVSVRLIAKVPDATVTAPPVSGTAPHGTRAASGGRVQPG